MLLSPSGRSDKIQFLHANCIPNVHKKFPDHISMTLPEATKDAESFLRCLDIDGNGVLEKSEVRAALAVMWDGDLPAFDKEFEAKWKLWDTDTSGGLSAAEIAGDAKSLGAIPESLLDWVRSHHEKCVRKSVVPR